MADIAPSDIELAYRAGQIKTKAERDIAMKNLQLGTSYLPVRYAQTWWHTMQEAVDDVVKQSMAAGGKESALGTVAATANASFWNSLTLLGAIFAPMSAAAKELARPIDGFLIDLGASPQVASVSTKIAELALNFVTPTGVVKAAGGVKAVLGTEKAAQDILKVKDAAKGIIEITKGEHVFSKAAAVVRAGGIGAYKEKTAAEALFERLVSPEGQKSVVQVAGAQSGELRAILAQGENTSAITQQGPKAPTATMAGTSKMEQLAAEREVRFLYASSAERSKMAADMIANKKIDELANMIGEDGFRALAEKQGLTAGALKRKLMGEEAAQSVTEYQAGRDVKLSEQAKVAQAEGQAAAAARAKASAELDIRNIIEDVNVQMRKRLSTEETLQKAATTIRGAPAIEATTSETQKTLEAAQATILGRNTPQEVINNLEAMRKRLVAKGCL